MGSAMEERVARSVALEKAYVHDVYEQFSEGPRGRPWPKVNQFLADLEPGSLVCDVGEFTHSTTFFTISFIPRRVQNSHLVPFYKPTMLYTKSAAIYHHPSPGWD